MNQGVTEEWMAQLPRYYLRPSERDRLLAEVRRLQAELERLRSEGR